MPQWVNNLEMRRKREFISFTEDCYKNEWLIIYSKFILFNIYHIAKSEAQHKIGLT